MRRALIFSRLILLAVLTASPSLTAAQDDPAWRAWNQPVKPFRLIGNIYYVGASDVTSFLITTPEGHILLDSGFAETVPLIEDNVKRLGFKLEDVKILINSHAHSDHAGGLARLKELTGASLVISEGDAELISNGGKGDFAWGDTLAYRPAKPDRLIRDKEKVELGGVTMVARLTPGHTKGCTTWTMKVRDGGGQLDVVFIGSTTAPGYKLVNNPQYPGIAADYAHTFELLKSLKCDVFLAPHGSFFALKEKSQRLEKGAKSNPFIDPDGYQQFIKRTESAYRAEVAKQQGDLKRKP